MRAKSHCFLFFLLFFCQLGVAQSFNLTKGKTYQKVKFNLINNLIVIPIEINGSKLSFILDTGVSKPLLFNLSDQDSIQINNVAEISINGLGGTEPIKALSSTGNLFRISNLENVDQMLYVILDQGFNLSPVMGMPIHGLIGYDLFRDFVVEINYATKTIKFHDPAFYEYKRNLKQETLPLTIQNQRAMVKGKVVLEDDLMIDVHLMVDTGSGDAVWLFPNEDKDIRLPEKNFHDFLGRGLSGGIFGKRTQIRRLELGSHMLMDTKAAFPDMEFFKRIIDLDNRNGSLGGEVLKRFNIIFDYPNNKITIGKNKYFSDPFEYNMSGIEIQHDGMRLISQSITDANGIVNSDERKFGNVQILMEHKTRLSLVPEIIVSGIRAGSPADLAGLQEGDLILSVNGKSVHNYKLQEVIKLLNERRGKEIRVLIERYNKDLLISFVLKDVFK